MNIRVIKDLPLVDSAKPVVCDEHKKMMAPNKEACYVITIGGKRIVLCDICYEDLQSAIEKGKV
jgi:hypothetical protein